MTFNSIQNVEDKRSEVKKIETPVLILRGQCDNQKWGFTKEYLDVFINSELKIIEGAGHNIINSKQEEYYQLIYDYLKE